MKLLLDSHAYLWWLADDERLGPGARETISDSGSVVFVSAVTIWELAIKAGLGRLEVADADLAAEIAANGFLELPVTAAHAAAAGALPHHHDDPFDRMLVAQARLEDLTCVTREPAFAAYEISTLW